jgi:hypothetical protein
MSLQITNPELEELEKAYSKVNIDESKNTASGKTEGLDEVTLLSSGKIAKFVYHYDDDSITLYALEEAPPPEPIAKLAAFLNANPDVKDLLGM